MKYAYITLLLILLLPFVTAKTPSLTQQQLDDIRSYVANSGAAVDYIVPIIDAAAEEMNQYIGSATPYNLFNKFSFNQQNQIILAVQKYAYPPPPPQKNAQDPVFSALDTLHQKYDQSERDLVNTFYPGMPQDQQDNLYNSWLTYKYDKLVCN